MKLSKPIYASLIAVSALVISLAASADVNPPPDPESAVVAESASSQLALSNAQRAFNAHLDLWRSADPAHYPYEALVANGAVYEFPYAAPPLRRIEGKAAIAQHLRSVAGSASGWEFSDITFFPTQVPEVFFVAFQSTAVVQETRRPYHQRYMIRITMDGEKIANLLMLWDQNARAAAFARAESH